MAKPEELVSYKSPDGMTWKASRFYKGTIDALFQAYAKLPAGQFGPGGALAWTQAISNMRTGALWIWTPESSSVNTQRKAVNANSVAKILGCTVADVLAVWAKTESLWMAGTQPSEPSAAILSLASKLPQQAAGAAKPKPKAAAGSNEAAAQQQIPAAMPAGEIPWTTIAAATLVVVGVTVAWWAWKK